MPKFVNEGRNDVAVKYFKGAYLMLYMGLYTNTAEPDVDATLTSGLTELAGAGYSRAEVSADDWTAVVNVITNIQKVFTAAGSWANVYGYFLATTADNTGKLVYVEHFSNGPYNIINGNTVRPKPIVTVT